MNTYSCTLHLGKLAIGGIKAETDVEAKLKAIQCFRPALLEIDERSVEVKIQEKEVSRIIGNLRLKFSVQEKRHVKRVVTAEICREIGRMTESELKPLVKLRK